ncbi:MAG: arginine repressor [Bdellovibrionaceae bacterium]|nr:arginine repressor [Pseudobdellovibrionaceae bacterium]
MSTPAEPKNETQARLQALRKLVRDGDAATQEEICEALREKNFDVTQSTVSRDLRRIGAVKITNPEGEATFHLPEELQALQPRVMLDLTGLVTDVQANEAMIVLHTAPGSASLVARHLDSLREDLGILGTIAGDDAIFVAPLSVKKMAAVMKKIKEEF